MNHIGIYYFELKLFYLDTFILIEIGYCFHFNTQAYNIMKQRPNINALERQNT